MILSSSISTSVRPSMRVLETSAMFGVNVDESHELTIVPSFELTLPVPGVVFITGPSGGGKTTLLRLIADGSQKEGRQVVWVDDRAPLPGVPLVDAFDLPLNETFDVLSQAGLAEAYLMVRTPAQLSDGQRARFRLARALAAARQGGVILADEFGATLDRITAQVTARNVRRWAHRAGVTFIAATTHDDLLESLQPDVLIYKGFHEEMEVVKR